MQAPQPPAYKDPPQNPPETPTEPLERPDLTAHLFPEARASRPVLRHGQLEDAPAIAALLIASKAFRWFKQTELARPFGGPGGGAPLPRDESEAREAVYDYVRTELAPRESARSWVAHVGGEIVGVAFVHWSHEEMLAHFVAVLDNLYVHSDWRKRGVGTQLLNACRATARVVEANVILLSRLLEAVKPSPRTFFTNRGFTQTPLGVGRTP